MQDKESVVPVHVSQVAMGLKRGLLFESLALMVREKAVGHIAFISANGLDLSLLAHHPVVVGDALGLRRGPGKLLLLVLPGGEVVLEAHVVVELFLAELAVNGFVAIHLVLFQLLSSLDL